MLIGYLDEKSLYTKKLMDYRDWRRVMEIKREGKLNSEEGRKEVEEIKGRMNRKRTINKWDLLNELNKEE